MAKAAKTAKKSADTTPAVKVPKYCMCQLGWTGTVGSGSTLKAAQDYTNPCSRLTSRSFAQGHDARMSSRLATEVADGLTDVEVAAQLIQMAGGTDLLESKMRRSAKLRAEKKSAVSSRKQAKDEAERVIKSVKADDTDEQLEAGAENLASDEGLTLNEARARVGLPVVNPTDDDEPAEPVAVGTEIKVRHGKKSYTAQVAELDSGERVAMHTITIGKNTSECAHDLATGDKIDLSDEQIPF